MHHVCWFHCLKGTNLCKDCQLSRSFKNNVNPNGGVSWELLRKLLASMVWIHQGPSRILIKKQLYSIMVIGHKCVVLDFVDLVLQRSEDMGEDLLEKDQKKQVGSARGTTRQQKPHGKLTENLRIRSMLSATCIMIFQEAGSWLPRSECSSSIQTLRCFQRMFLHLVSERDEFQLPHLAKAWFKQPISGLCLALSCDARGLVCHGPRALAEI